MESNERNSNEEQSMAAGLIEGYLTEDLIYTHSKNIYGEKQPSKHVRRVFSLSAADSAHS